MRRRREDVLKEERAVSREAAGNGLMIGHSAEVNSRSTQTPRAPIRAPMLLILSRSTLTWGHIIYIHDIVCNVEYFIIDYGR